MHIIMFLLFGLFVGALARFLVPGKEKGGWGVSMLIGIAGSMLGGYAGQFTGYYDAGQTAGFVVSLLGAIAIVALYHGLMSGGMRKASS